VEPQITWYAESAIRIVTGGMRIIIDPFRIPDDQPETDVLLVSHDHPEHLSSRDIERVVGAHTAVFASRVAAEKLAGISNVQVIEAGDVVQHGALTMEGVPAHNVNKFTGSGALVHPPEAGSLGFLLEIDDLSFYFSGDTDVIPEMERIGPVDYAFLSVGGTTVMTAEEAAQAASSVQPSIAIPIHYGASAGTVEDACRFAELVPDQVRVWIMNQSGNPSMPHH
jgi:L-ascorbate metabolism protein UlaG (beta-lactamase superfamily)